MSKEDPIIKAFNEVVRLIQATKNDKLYYTFLNLYDLQVKDFRKQITNIEKYYKEENTKMNKLGIRLENVERDVFDFDIKNEHLVTNKSIEMINKLNTFQKAVLARPRFYGLGLLVFGRSLIKTAENIDKENNHTTNSESSNS